MTPISKAPISRWVGAFGLVLALGLAGCGKQPFEAAIPADQPVTFTTVSDRPETATAVLQNLGTAGLIKLEGQHFQTTGAYSVWAQRPNGRLAGGIGTAPYSPSVGADGTVHYFNTFSLTSVFNEPLKLVIYYHPSGDPTDFSRAEIVAATPLPAQY